MGASVAGLGLGGLCVKVSCPSVRLSFLAVHFGQGRIVLAGGPAFRLLLMGPSVLLAFSRASLSIAPRHLCFEIVHPA
jgi:hypothetical protein